MKSIVMVLAAGVLLACGACCCCHIEPDPNWHYVKVGEVNGVGIYNRMPIEPNEPRGSPLPGCEIVLHLRDPGE